MTTDRTSSSAATLPSGACNSGGKCLLRDEPHTSGGDAATGRADQPLRRMEIRPALTHQRAGRLGGDGLTGVGGCRFRESIRRLPRDPQNSSKDLNEFMIAPTELMKTSPTSSARSSSSRRSSSRTTEWVAQAASHDTTNRSRSTVNAATLMRPRDKRPGGRDLASTLASV
jgi:hypothetical protein